MTKATISPVSHPSPMPFLSSSLSPDTYLTVPPAAEGENYTMFDLNLDEVEVTLSFMRWLDGKGLVKDAKIKGVRGVVGASLVLPLVLLSQSLTTARRSTICMVGPVETPRPRRFSA